jgi:hypothetical protein
MQVQRSASSRQRSIRGLRRLFNSVALRIKAHMIVAYSNPFTFVLSIDGNVGKMSNLVAADLH